MSLENITVNGVPLKEVVAIEVANEIRQVKQTENSNHSGSRSGKCRIIYSKDLGVL